MQGDTRRSTNGAQIKRMRAIELVLINLQIVAKIDYPKMELRALQADFKFMVFKRDQLIKTE